MALASGRRRRCCARSAWRAGSARASACGAADGRRLESLPPTHVRAGRGSLLREPFVGMAAVSRFRPRARADPRGRRRTRRGFRGSHARIAGRSPADRHHQIRRHLSKGQPACYSGPRSRPGKTGAFAAPMFGRSRLPADPRRREPADRTRRHAARAGRRFHLEPGAAWLRCRPPVAVARHAVWRSEHDGHVEGPQAACETPRPHQLPAAGPASARAAPFAVAQRCFKAHRLPCFRHGRRRGAHLV